MKGRSTDAPAWSRAVERSASECEPPRSQRSSSWASCSGSGEATPGECSTGEEDVQGDGDEAGLGVLGGGKVAPTAAHVAERALAPVRGAKCGERAAHATEGGLSTQRVARVGRMAQRRRAAVRREHALVRHVVGDDSTSLETEDLKVRPREQHASQGRELGGGRHLATRRAPPTAPAVLKFTTSSHKLFGRSPLRIS